MKPQRTVQTAGTSLLALIAAATLIACDRDDRTAGQQIDQTTARVEQKTEEVRADAREATRDIAAATNRAADAAGDKVKDAAITAAVNAELVKDPKLSALRIDVDTVAGRVALRGTAPDAESRERASTLAAKVDGVTGVENQLTVGPKS